ncbi:cation ABC transporter substrate-binding protein [candidate division KSB3 bacterium]|uniref:Cation ABC transporter substrate-binding protein n=1 Tax=candidate division KSB3 bacterium TaxID=2044937 RepID=A0A9D5JXN4_9BACT|nr:cation ABC transporter substrate-binding protein [candidate division KSB3 bacterium]MBD3326207.1 cation ABC transporter substrate-binding protein [candidate division KSB3 bacterium]
MKTRVMILLLIAISIACLAQHAPLHAADRLQVVVSIPPQTYFVHQIGGDLVDVMSMLPEGAFPHTFEPTAKQMKLLSTADMYVRIRVEFENAWWEKIRAANPDMHVIDSTTGITFIEGETEHHDTAETHHHHGHHGRDPHTWLSPSLVKIQAEAICDGLIHLDPQHQGTYLAQKQTFLNALDTLDQDLREMFVDLPTRTFMVFHPSWAYFAKAYNLTQISIEIEGKEPSVAEMAELMKIAQQEQISTIFVQPQTSRRSAEIIARQIGASLEGLNPLAADWMENMRRVAKKLVAALGQ